MKTKTMAISMALTFFSCSLFAQNQTDTVPQTTPQTDSIPKTDTAKTDSTNASVFIVQPKNLKSVSQSNDAFTQALVYAPAKENEEEVSSK